MTQEQIADAIGLTSVHVNRMPRTLDEAGLIIGSKGPVIIRNLQALADTGDFRSTCLHQGGPAAREIGS